MRLHWQDVCLTTKWEKASEWPYTHSLRLQWAADLSKWEIQYSINPAVRCIPVISIPQATGRQPVKKVHSFQMLGAVVGMLPGLLKSVWRTWLAGLVTIFSLSITNHLRDNKHQSAPLPTPASTSYRIQPTVMLHSPCFMLHHVQGKGYLCLHTDFACIVDKCILHEFGANPSPESQHLQRIWCTAKGPFKNKSNVFPI